MFSVLHTLTLRLLKTFSLKESAFEDYWIKEPGTLESGIDVGQGINVGPGKLGKKNKRRALNTHVLCSE